MMEQKKEVVELMWWSYKKGYADAIEMLKQGLVELDGVDLNKLIDLNKIKVVLNEEK